MTVLDVIIKLQQLPPNAECLLDITTDGMEMFKFAAPVYIDTMELEEYGNVVVLSAVDYNDVVDDEDEYPFELN